MSPDMQSLSGHRLGTPLPDGTAITPTTAAGANTQINTQAAGTLPVNAPTGTPVDGQRLQLRLKCTNVQTFAWNATYRAGVTVAMPTATTGTSKTDRIVFEWNATDSKWDLVLAVFGF
jgi:hypothetical protein